MSSSLMIIVSAAATLVTALVIVGWLTRGIGDPERTVTWARSHGVVVTPANRALVVWWVRLSGTLRVVGGVSGMVIGSLFDDAFGVDTSAGPGFWAWITVGWVAGGTWAWAAVTSATTTDAGAAAASLVPRRLADYVPPVVRWAPAAAAAVTVGIVVADRWLGPADDDLGFAVAGAIDLWLLALGAVGLAVAARLLLGRVIARRQPPGDPDAVAVDDAIRATTTHLIAGGATAAILLLALQAAEMVLLTRSLPFGLRGWVPAILVIAAWMSGRYLANRPWRVRRDRGRRTPVAS